MKRYLFAAGILFVLAVLFVSVKGAYSHKESKAQEKPPLIYYTIGREDEDLEMVNEALNDLLSRKYGITVDYRKLDWNIYGNKISVYLNLNENLDVVFASNVHQGDYVGNAKKGAWYPLDDFLAGEGKALYEAIPEIWWEGAKINGHIYGVPTSKELASVSQWMYPKELVDKYDIDIESIKSLEDLEPVFALIQKNEREYTVMELNQYTHFFEVYGYEYILDYQIPLMIKSEDEEVKLVNILETDVGEQVLNTLRKYYLAGYINKDAPIRESQTLQEGEKVFFRQAQGGPYAEMVWSRQRGYEVVAQVMSPAVIDIDSLRGAYMCVAASSEQPKEACRFLLAVNTDKEVRNLLQHGIEGEHYKRNAQGQVVMLKETYMGVAYTQGNLFLLDTKEGWPIDLPEKYREFNERAVPSPLIDAELDLSEIEEEISAVRAVSEKYCPALMTGSVDVSEYLPAYCKELREAGIDRIRDELQKQLKK